MRLKAILAASAAVILASTLAGCTEQSLVVDGSSVSVASAQAFTSFNDQTSFGNTAANRAIVGATNSGFTYYDDEARLVQDESFGHYEIVSQSPFTVKYTIAEGVTWSDGVPVDGADLLLAWAANSGHLNTEGFNPARFIDDETGQFTDFPDGKVYFDGASHSGLQYVSKVPDLGADGRSITLEYDEFFVDWELAFKVGVPAHVVGERALRVTKKKDESLASASKREVIAAIEDGDVASLAPLAAAWNSAFTVGTADPAEDFVGSGPYSVTKVVPNESVTLTVNPLYTGERKPRFETIVVRTIADPLEAVKALAAGEVDVIAPSPTADVVDALDAAPDIRVEIGASGTFEHIDLQFSQGKNATFDDPLLREAFLDVVPREQIVSELIAPVAPEASARSSLVLGPWDDEDPGSIPTVDVAGARRLIAKAGVAAPVVCILFDPANPRRLAEFDLIAESAERAGFVVDDCSTSDWEGFLGVPGAYDAALFAWSESTNAVSAPDARLHSGSTVSNYSHYSSKVVDGLLDELSVESDPVAQKALLRRIDSALEADSYGAALYQFPSIVAHSTRVEAVTGSPFSGVMWNVWQWRPAAKDE